MRVSLYDPRYFMPLVSTVRVNVNFEPIEGTVEVTPLEGDSLDTVFTIKALNFVDEDSPLTFRFFYYQTQEIYEEERALGVNPVSSRRDFLRDAGFRNELSTKIVMGK